MKLLAAVLICCLCSCNGQEYNGSESCSFWYYKMPQSIECRAGIHFSTGCGVKVPCGFETEVEWYWSPAYSPDSAIHITNTDSTKVRVLAASREMCKYDSATLLGDLYTLTISNLSNDHNGYYWCQMRVVESGYGIPGDLMPSNQCYVSTGSSPSICDYGSHKDQWMCAQTGVENETSDTFGNPSESVRPTRGVTNIISTAALSNFPHPTVGITGEDEPCNIDNNRLTTMSVTVIEAVFLVIIVFCSVLVSFLLGCLIKRRRKASGISERQWHRKSKPDSAPTDPAPRYTPGPVSTLTRTFSFPQLSSSSYLHGGATPSELNPYQELNLDSIDYTTMYNKPSHEYAGIKPARATGSECKKM